MFENYIYFSGCLFGYNLLRMTCYLWFFDETENANILRVIFNLEIVNYIFRICYCSAIKIDHGRLETNWKDVSKEVSYTFLDKIFRKVWENQSKTSVLWITLTNLHLFSASAGAHNNPTQLQKQNSYGTNDLNFSSKSFIVQKIAEKFLRKLGSLMVEKKIPVS